MFHGRQIYDKVNKLHERALRIVYNDTVTSFENLMIKDKYFMIHHQNIQLLVIEIYRTIHNLPGGNLSEFFVRNNHNRCKNRSLFGKESFLRIRELR